MRRSSASRPCSRATKVSPNPNHNPNHPNHSNHPKPNQVGSGISLEYFFSTTDGGAGTKVPVSVVSTLTLTLTHP